MKCFFQVFFSLTLFVAGCTNPESETLETEDISVELDYPATPDSLYGSLFTDVQMQQVFPDGKTFVDCIPKEAPLLIRQQYEAIRNQNPDLKKFVADHFYLPVIPEVKSTEAEKDITKHIKDLWPVLTRKPDSVIPGSSLLALPYPYIVPGGRFREIYYWDSYFTMLGLKASGETDMIENMTKNFAYLIQTYGHIPNGNRSYYLSRSQPPFFSLMVALLASVKGESVYPLYLNEVEKEYAYWMEGDKKLRPGEARKRVVKMPDGSLLNRYWDDRETPRQESYREDVETAKKAVESLAAKQVFGTPSDSLRYLEKTEKLTYRNLRAGACSGWDFSSRWFADPTDISTIETTSIVPVDLNCLLYFTETLLAKMYTQKGDNDKASTYNKWANERKDAINRYCYSDSLHFYTDYAFASQKMTNRVTAAGLFPFCFFDSTSLKEKAALAAVVVRNQLLAPGGLLTTPVTNGQQWDAPNGWAPLQWMAVWGLSRCGQQNLASDIAQRWIALNKNVYSRTGKLMEKYNVVNTQLEAGGGEYPGQDGFGWTNGVLLALMEKYKAY